MLTEQPRTTADLAPQSGGLPKVLVVLGTRPEAIKLLPVVHALRASERFTPIVVTTGQHHEVVSEVLALGDVTPDVSIDVMRPGATLSELTARLLEGLAPVLDPLGAGGKPDPLDRLHDRMAVRMPGTGWDAVDHDALGRTDDVAAALDGRPIGVLVQGDTTTALVGALAAFYHRVPVGHVEAGLRTDDRWNPYPEEMNRRLVTQLATVHFAATPRARANLIHEGVPFDRIVVTGNTVIDALRWAADLRVPWTDAALRRLDDDDRPLLVVTAHRRENWDGGIAQIADAVARVARERPALHVVWSLHPNPAVRAEIEPRISGLSNVVATTPLEYAEFARLLARATVVLTDSGGIQEEAPALGVPVLVTRDTTERPEAVATGVARLVGTDVDAILAEVERLVDDPAAHGATAHVANPFGDGEAARRIVEALGALVYGTPAPSEFGDALDRRSVLRAAGYPRSHLDSSPAQALAGLPRRV